MTLIVPTMQKVGKVFQLKENFFWEIKKKIKLYQKKIKKKKSNSAASVCLLALASLIYIEKKKKMSTSFF